MTGKVNQTINITSPGGNVIVTIYNGTNATVNGTGINNITIDSNKAATYALSGIDTFMGENLTLGPDGARFSPDIQLRFNYTEVQLKAAGIKESELTVKFYNTTSNKWEAQPIIERNVTSNPRYIIASISHFSTFALIGTPTPSIPAKVNTGGNGGSGGGGSGSSGENFSNIEIKEKNDLYIYKEKVTSYKFTDPRNPILLINITGNSNAGEITATVEVLKTTSILVNSPAPGKVYKNVNVWVGTSGFVQPKNIKIAVIRFVVPNTWLENNNIGAKEIKVVRWDGSKWATLDTNVKEKESSVTSFEATTDSFSTLAITGLIEPVSAAKPQVKSTSGITMTSTPVINDVVPSKGALPVNLQIIFVIAMIGIVIPVYFKWKNGKIR
jgi:PGF-pre-PGF domain-containing protein